MAVFKAFSSTANPNVTSDAMTHRWLANALTGAIVGISNQNANGPDARFTPVDLTAAQIASPSAAMIADLDAMYRLNVAPYTRYISNGTTLVAAAGVGGAGNPAGSNSQLQYNAAGIFGGISGVTSDGALVAFLSGALTLLGATSGTAVLNAPATGGGTVTLPAGSVTLLASGGALGTPASGVATNLTGLPLTTGVTGTLGIGNGGTGQTTANAAFNALSPMTAGGDIIFGGAGGIATRLANGTANQVLQSNGTTLAPSWVTLAGGGNALTSNPLSQFAATTSAQLAGVMSDETGSGPLVFATTPVFTSAITLGTQQTTQGSIVLANTAAGAFATTLQASNSATAAWTLTLPTTAGSNGQVLSTNGSGVTSWIAAGGAASITIGTSTITSGTPTRLLYDNAGVVGEITGATSNGTALTLVAPVLGAATGTSLALGGATIGADVFAGTGTATLSGKMTAGSFNVTSATIPANGMYLDSANSLSFSTNSTVRATFDASNDFTLASSSSSIAWAGSTFFDTGAFDGGFRFGNSGAGALMYLQSIGSTGAPNLRFGKPASASPLSVILTPGESSRGGTDSNIAGGTATIRSGLGTGTATVAPMLFQVGVVQASGTTQHTYATAITINNSTATGLRFNGYGAGTITADGSGNLTAVSDPRMKNIQREFTDGLAAIRKITPIVYKWKRESGMESENEYAGFDAQNVRDHMEFATWKGKDGLLSLQDRALLAACINAIKELASLHA